MENKDYKQIIETARKSVEGLNLDDALKMKAFEKVLDDLLGNNKTINDQIQITNIQKKKRSGSQKKVNSETKIEQEHLEIINKLKAEDFDKIHDLKKNLDLSLYLLQVLKDKYSTDGLIPSEIAIILSEKFRIKSNQFGIGMALMKAKEYVDRHQTTTKGGTAYKYRIMKKGEEYIKKKLIDFNNHSGLKAETSNTKLNSSNVLG